MAKQSEFIRIPGKGFQPFNEEDFSRVQPGEIIMVTWSKSRNPRFHRKAMALFKYIHECLPDECRPIEYKGHKIIPQRNFDQTRKWLTIEAGFYEVYWVGGAHNGRMIVEPKSLAFGSMDENEFEAVYNSLIDVALEMLPNVLDATQLDAAIETVLRFDGGG